MIVAELVECIKVKETWVHDKQIEINIGKNVVGVKSSVKYLDTCHFVWNVSYIILIFFR